MSAVALPQIPLGELTALPRPPSWFQGGRFAAGGERREGLGGVRRGEGRGNGEGREKGEVGGIAHWLLGASTPLNAGRDGDSPYFLSKRDTSLGLSLLKKSA